MLPRERVITVMQHGKPDRIPIYGMLRANLEEQITEAFGSVEDFEDKYEFDFAHLFGGPAPHPLEALKQLRQTLGRAIEPKDLLGVELGDPNNTAAYEDIRKQIRHHKEERGRFVYVQTPGIFECLNGPFGIQNHLCHLLTYEDDLHQVYRRQAEWNRTFAMNCLDLGVDMIHVSDDWGAQNGLMFSPDVWWRLIHPYHKITCDAVKGRGAYVSMHSDGNVNSVIDGIIDLGFDAFHPWQESAGMSYQTYKEKCAGDFVLIGGLDVQTTIGFGKPDVLKSEIERVMRTFANGNLLFSTSHYVQDHCTIEELTLAYDTIYELAREVCQ